MDITSNASTSSSSWDLDMAMGNQLLSTDQTTPFLMVPPMDPFHLAPPSFPTSQFGVLREVAGHEDDQEQQQEQDQDQEEEETLGAMKEMMYKIAAMQPVDIDTSMIKKPKRRNVRISDDPQSIAARHRRERISERIRILQRLVPGGTKMDTASMLDEAIRYVKFLKRQVQELQTNPPPVTAPHVGTGILGGHQAGPGGWLVRPDTFHDLSSSSTGAPPAGLGFHFDGAWADPRGN